MKKRYVLHPGIVSSATEGKCYFVSASTLAYLHGVDMQDCRIADSTAPASRENEEVLEIHLYPAWEDKEGSLPVTVTSVPDSAGLLDPVE